MFQLLSVGQSMNPICSDLHMSKCIVHTYKQQAVQSGCFFDELLHLSDTVLAVLLQSASSVLQPDVRKDILELQLDAYLSKFSRLHITTQ